jgi:hypothetical protein
MTSWLHRGGHNISSYEHDQKTCLVESLWTMNSQIWSQTFSSGGKAEGSDAAVRKLATPYLLATAKVPLKALDFQWTLGSNQSINPKQVRTLLDEVVHLLS